MGQEAQKSKWKSEKKILLILNWDPTGLFILSKGKPKVIPHSPSNKSREKGGRVPLWMKGINSHHLGDPELSMKQSCISSVPSASAQKKQMLNSLGGKHFHSRLQGPPQRSSQGQ